MPSILTDAHIDELINERKPLAANYRHQIQMKDKPAHKEGELTVSGDNNNIFVLIKRQNIINPLNFSVILAYKIPSTNRNFLLRRYNGNSHEHTNNIEKHKIHYKFHIHMATERYQNAGWSEEAYAEPTTRYADINGAMECLIEDCGFIVHPDIQRLLPFEALELESD